MIPTTKCKKISENLNHWKIQNLEPKLNHGALFFCNNRIIIVVVLMERNKSFALSQSDPICIPQPIYIVFVVKWDLGMGGRTKVFWSLRWRAKCGCHCCRGSPTHHLRSPTKELKTRWAERERESLNGKGGEKIEEKQERKSEKYTNCRNKVWFFSYSAIIIIIIIHIAFITDILVWKLHPHSKMEWIKF